MRKEQINQIAWKWTFDIKLECFEESKITRKQLETSYRLKLNACRENTCRRNCRGKPLCIWGLGEKEWFSDANDEDWDNDDFADERREPHGFVGLKNLGATCYANSLLQLWYHNLDFRKAIYSWDPYYDPQVSSPKFDGDDFDLTTSVAGQLQRIFALLQYSHKRYVDPTPFISALGIDTETQQDAEEFSKLFITLLEEKLQHQKDSVLSQITQDQYQGVYVYVTKCLKCQSESQCESRFYELDLNIRGHKELQDSLKEFLHAEKLEGTNQYFCTCCQKKNDAVRYIKLVKLPPVLNLQLKRFVFDRQTGTKKKLNSFISIPKTLSWSEISPELSGSCLYDLTAVLIHKGSGANCGHYVAHILDEKTRSWFKFNDEEIAPVNKGSELGMEKDGSDDCKKIIKSIKLSKDLHVSNNAYMLVYSRRVSDKTDSYLTFEPWVLPEHLQKFVDDDNSQFDDRQRKCYEDRLMERELDKLKRLEVREQYKKMALTDKGKYEFIPAEWLKSWLSKDTVERIDNTPFFCDHGKVDPDKIEGLKCISIESAAFFLSKYGGGPRLTQDDLCPTCVYHKCVTLRREDKLNAVAKAVAKYSKEKVDNGCCYWVGKQSLRSWKKLLLSQWNGFNYMNGHNNHKSEENDNSEADEVSSIPDEPVLVQNSAKDSKETILSHSICDPLPCLIESYSKNELDNDDVKGASSPDLENGESDTSMSVQLKYLNEDIMCFHGNLRLDPNCRRLVSEEFWNYLKGHFHNAPVFPVDSTPCGDCSKLAEETNILKEKHKAMALEQKTMLPYLYADKNRPSFDQGFQLVFVVPNEFIDSWRRFIRDPLRKHPVSHIRNKELLCAHGGLLWDYEVNLSNESDMNNSFVMVWPTEWEYLKTSFTVDSDISIKLIENELISEPKVCDICVKEQRVKEETKLLDYSKATIYIRKVNDLQEPAEPMEVQDVDDGDQPSAKKKKKLALAIIRRSERSKRLRGEKEFQVYSKQTLLDLKIRAMKLFGVPTYDQHLYLNGAELLDSSATLAELRIFPGCLLLLKADEVMGSDKDSEDINYSNDHEVGFKGTELIPNNGIGG